MRQARAGEVVCNCAAYEFPHRWSGGACSCLKWVKRFHDPHKQQCRDCINADNNECQVAQQREMTFHCPALREYVRYEAVKLYGKAGREYARATCKRAA